MDKNNMTIGLKSSTNELVSWFQVNYPDLVKAMKEAQHHYDETLLNPYRLEGDKPKQIAYAGAEFKGDQCNGSVRVTFSDGAKLSFIVDGLTDDWSDMKQNSTIS